MGGPGHRIAWCVGAALLGSPALGVPPAPADLPTVRTRSMDLNYEVNLGGQPLQLVELWVTSDGGVQWDLYATDPDACPPLRFEAAHDGVFGFYFVLGNTTGRSCPQPQSGQAAHHWVLVDSHPPLVQIRGMEWIGSVTDSPAVLVIDWVAHDAYLDTHPVTLKYQVPGEFDWKVLARSIPNVGRFDWAVPPGLCGPVTIKLEVVDLAGHIAADLSSPLAIPQHNCRLAQEGPHRASADQPAAPDPPALIGDRTHAPSTQRAKELLALGRWHQDRGDYALAVERYLEAIACDPDLTTPAFALADIYQRQRNHQGALDIYDNILGRDPLNRNALHGSALALISQRQYSGALARLQQVLKQQPRDAETWLHAGDVLLWMGRRQQAADYWREAVRLSPSDSEFARQARQRTRKFQ